MRALRIRDRAHDLKMKITRQILLLAVTAVTLTGTWVAKLSFTVHQCLPVLHAVCQNDAELEKRCNAQTNCRDCIRAAPKCSWCKKFKVSVCTRVNYTAWYNYFAAGPCAKRFLLEKALNNKLLATPLITTQK